MGKETVEELLKRIEALEDREKERENLIWTLFRAMETYVTFSATGREE